MLPIVRLVKVNKYKTKQLHVQQHLYLSVHLAKINAQKHTQKRK